MGLQAGGTPAARGGAAGHGNGWRQGHAPAGFLGVRIALATLEGGVAESALAHGCV